MERQDCPTEFQRYESLRRRHSERRYGSTWAKVFRPNGKWSLFSLSTPTMPWIKSSTGIKEVTTALVTSLSWIFLFIIMDILRKKIAAHLIPPTHKITIQVVHTHRATRHVVRIRVHRQKCISQLGVDRPTPCQRLTGERTLEIAKVKFIPTSADRAEQLSAWTQYLSSWLQLLISSLWSLVPRMDFASLHKHAHRTPSHCHRLLRKTLPKSQA